MSDVIIVFLVFLAGLLTGTFFFVGLWWTVKKGTSSGNPALWFVLSLLVRFAVTLGSFYLICGAHWERMLVCLAGFIVARVIVARMIRVREVKTVQ